MPKSFNRVGQTLIINTMDRNFVSTRIIPHNIICGPHNPLFFKYADIIRVAIDKLKLTPMAFSKKDSVATAEMEFLPPWWKYGGIKVAHLHFQDQVYLLNHEQWSSFSRDLMKSFSKTLAQAQGVSFDNALGISDVFESIV